MVPFDQTVEICDLPQCATFGKVSLCFEFCKRLWVDSMFIDTDHTRRACMRGNESFEQELLRRLCISRRAEAEEEIECLPL
jgi:hypothetical protein